MRLVSVVLVGAAWALGACDGDEKSGGVDATVGEVAETTGVDVVAETTVVAETVVETVAETLADTTVAETVADTPDVGVVETSADTSDTPVTPPYEGFERVWSRMIQASFHQTAPGGIMIRPPTATLLGTRTIGNGTDGVMLIVLSLPSSDIALVDPNAAEGAEGAVQPLPDLNSDTARVAVLGLKQADGSVVFDAVLQTLADGESVGEVGRLPSGLGVTILTPEGSHVVTAQVFGTALRTATIKAQSGKDTPLALAFPAGARVDQGSGGGGFGGGGGGPTPPANMPIVLAVEASGDLGDALVVTPGGTGGTGAETAAFEVAYDGPAAGMGLVAARLAYATDTAVWPAEGHDALFMPGLEVGAINDATAGPIFAAHVTADTTVGGTALEAGMAVFVQVLTSEAAALTPTTFWSTDGAVDFDQVAADSYGGFEVLGSATGTVKFGDDVVTAPTGARAFLGHVQADGNLLLFQAEGCDAIQEINVSRSFRMIHTPCGDTATRKSVMLWQRSVDQDGKLQEPVDVLMGQAAEGFEPLVTSPIISLPAAGGRATGAVIDLGAGQVELSVIDSEGVPYDVGAVADLAGDGTPSWIATVRNSGGGGFNSNEILYAVNGSVGAGFGSPLLGRAHVSPRLVIE